MYDPPLERTGFEPWVPEATYPGLHPAHGIRPPALTGPLGSVGQQLKRGGEMWAKVAKGLNSYRR